MRIASYEEAVALGLGDVWREQMSPRQEAPKPAPEVAKAKAVPRSAGPNKTEARFCRGLDRMQSDGSILAWEYEPVKFRIAERCWYTVDFRVVLPSLQSVFVETKGGFIREDAMVKLRAVAEREPHAFFLAQFLKPAWTITRMPSRKWGVIKAEIDWDI